MRLSVVADTHTSIGGLDMPKAKPTQVVVHRIELQDKEREMLEAYVGGSVIGNTLIPVAVVGGVGSAAYIGYKTAKALAGWTDDIVDDIKRTPIGAYANAAYTTEGATLPPPVRGIYRLAAWLGRPMK
jgi:hypothetical protein